jgi:hypothetical protein
MLTRQRAEVSSRGADGAETHEIDAAGLGGGAESYRRLGMVLLRRRFTSMVGKRQP